jgi:3-deoxy-D-manno-octulosonic-acid transferase
MDSLYSFLFTIWVLAMSPYFLYNAWRHKKYLPALRQRLGFLPSALKSDGRPTFWIHACSVGEMLSVQPIAQGLLELYPDARLVFSAITKGGYAIAKDRFANYGGNVFYFPIDLAGIAHKVLDTIQPTMMITVDTEIWPNVLRETRRRGVPIVMINGRISAKSFRWYRHLQPLLAHVLENYRYLLMKSDEDAERIQRMGARPSRIHVTGNIKYDRLAAEIGTHDDEEATLLQVLSNIHAVPELANTRLLIAPRHPERFGPVAALVRRSGFRLRRRSCPEGGDPDPQVLLLDTIGELGTTYQFATLVFIGGTLIPHGGQSIMEPAAYGKPVVAGPSMKNFPGIIDDFLAARAVVQIPESDDNKPGQVASLTKAMIRLLGDTCERERMGDAALAIFKENRGATQRTLDKIAEIYAEVTTR